MRPGPRARRVREGWRSSAAGRSFRSPPPAVSVSLLSDFKAFALRGNLIDLAIGFTVGAAFTTVAESLVNDLLMPPLGVLLGRTDFSDYYLLLQDGAPSGPYETLEAAQAAGAVTWNYGSFLTSLVTFLIVALAVFALVRTVRRIGRSVEDEFGQSDAPEAPETKKCAYCREAVPYAASRCSHCTSFLGVAGGPLTPDAAITPSAAPSTPAA